MKNSSFDQSWRIPASYRLFRAMVRLGVWLAYPEVRLLNRQKLQTSQPAILVVNGPASFRTAMLLVATLDSPALFLLPSQCMCGMFRKPICRGLGMVPADSKPEDQSRELSVLASALANWRAVAMFAGTSGKNTGGRPSVADFAVKVASEAAKQQVQPAIYALHGLLPMEGQKTVPLVYVEGPIKPQPLSEEPDDDYAEPSERLANAVAKALKANVFSLAPVEIGRFLRDLEDISHEDLEEEWSKRADWKQHAADLRLSSLVEQWMSERNQTDPASLVALKSMVEEYREARRRCSAGRLMMETSGSWRESTLRVAGAWLESLLGFPVALYGAVNHAAAGAILYAAGLLKKSDQRDPKTEWLLRAFAVLGCYTLQILLFNASKGRAAAGYYALTLPLSGAYLWRYLWLIRKRGHFLFWQATLPGRSTRLARTRKTLMGKIEREVALFAESLGMPS